MFWNSLSFFVGLLALVDATKRQKKDVNVITAKKSAIRSPGDKFGVKGFKLDRRMMPTSKFPTMNNNKHSSAGAKNMLNKGEFRKVSTEATASFLNVDYYSTGCGAIRTRQSFRLNYCVAVPGAKNTFDGSFKFYAVQHDLSTDNDATIYYLLAQEKYDSQDCTGESTQEVLSWMGVPETCGKPIFFNSNRTMTNDDAFGNSYYGGDDYYYYSYDDMTDDAVGDDAAGDDGSLVKSVKKPHRASRPRTTDDMTGDDYTSDDDGSAVIWKAFLSNGEDIPVGKGMFSGVYADNTGDACTDQDKTKLFKYVWVPFYDENSQPICSEGDGASESYDCGSGNFTFTSYSDWNCTTIRNQQSIPLNKMPNCEARNRTNENVWVNRYPSGYFCTGVPTASPTLAPTIPSVTTTKSPTLSPTHNPTVAPTVKIEDEKLTFSVSQTLSGITADNFNANFALNSKIFKLALVNSTDSLRFQDIEVSQATSVSTSSARKLRLSVLADSAVVPYTITIDSTADAGFTSGDTAYTSIVSDLQTAISSGSFTTNLNTNAASNGATVLASVTASTTPTVGEKTVTSNSDKTEDKKPPMGAIIGGIIGAIVLVGIAVGVAYYLCCRSSKVAVNS